MNTKPIKPWEITAFIALVLGALGALVFIFPSEGFNLGGDVKIRFYNVETITAEKPTYFNLDSLLVATAITDSIQRKLVPDTSAEVVGKAPALKRDTLRAQQSLLESRIQPIQFPDNKDYMLHPLFKEWKSGNVRKSLIRILHYGDSQIEGDRITRNLRNRFQKRFGGSGPGLLPCFRPVSESSSMTISTDGLWKSYNVMVDRDSSVSRVNFGILGSSAKLIERDTVAKGRLNYLISKYSYVSVRHFKWARLFFGNGGGDFNLSVYEQDSLLLTDVVDGTGPLQFFGLQLNHTPEDLRFEVSGANLPHFYALSLDQPAGIAVDNIAWRGSRGAEFTKIEQQVLTRFFRQLNVKLIIFQFGVNVVPHVVKSYGFYERQLIRQLQYLKQAAGEIPVLVVGVSDMSRKVNGWYESYPNITKIRDAQRNAAFKSNCAFWDMYEAMGGKNSMPAWVFAEPSLARKDFTHFNFRGASLIAQMLYNAIMNEYAKYNPGKAE